MNNINLIRCKVMTVGNRLHSKGLTLSQALKRAWIIVKSGVMTKVKGVTFGNAQKALDRLTAYPKEDIIISLKRDRANLYDSNAVEVYAGVKNKGVVKIGYLPAPLAFIVSVLIDKGIEIKASYGEIRGKYESYMHYGIAVKLSI